MRIHLTVVTLAALTAGLLSAAPSSAADAPITRLYLHSAAGSYAADVQAGGAPYTAPKGSAATTAAPTKTTSATARGQGLVLPGGALTPTWSTPVTGTVRFVCIDVFLASTALGTTSPGVNKTVVVNHRLTNGDAASNTVNSKSVSQEGFPNGVQRLTKLVSADGGFDVTPATLLSLYGNTGTNPDWTLHYDSVTHFSSITFNMPNDKCTPQHLPAPKPAKK